MMAEVRPFIEAQLRRYPQAELIDLFKLIYQNEFGCGHLVTDPGGNFRRLLDEIAALPEQADDSPAVEQIGGGFCRLHLRAMKQTGLSPKTLQSIFLLSAEKQTGDKGSFLQKIAELRRLCENEILPFCANDVDEVLKRWEDSGGGLFRHSAAFNQEYIPAYRVVEQRFCDFLPLFSMIDRGVQTKTDGKPLMIAIDGRCAAGKTTLTALLNAVYAGECNVLMMDEFFLRTEQRTAQRLSNPGENVDHERFLHEVLIPLSEGRGFSYRPFDCKRMDFAQPAAIQPRKIAVVEGSYSLHPALSGYYDVKVFMDIAKDEQLQRLRKRESEDSVRMFESRWIPLEERYFEAFQVRGQCDLVFE
jgi:uridine kinase